MRAAKREGRAPELDTGNAAGKNNEQQPGTQQTQRTPANDHLPHNVIMLSREHEKTFNAQEQARETADREQRAALKAEQRAEREAFFKDGAKEFKALRHAVYDEVRKEYAPGMAAALQGRQGSGAIRRGLVEKLCHARALLCQGGKVGRGGQRLR